MQEEELYINFRKIKSIESLNDTKIIKAFKFD